MTIEKLSVITLVNDSELYARSRASLDSQGGDIGIEFIPIFADKQVWNAATALNYGVERATSDWVVCAHQDVLFPDFWLSRFISSLAALPEKAAVAGLVGQRPNGSFAGHVKDPHGHLIWGPLPARVMSVDEHFIALRKSLGPRFDPENPGFHCYGTDICLSVLELGFQAFVVDAPVIHRSAGKIDSSFGVSSAWLLKKWGYKYLDVIPTCAALLEKRHFYNRLRKARIKIMRRLSTKPGVHVCDCDAVACANER